MIKHIFLDFFGVCASEVSPVWLRAHMNEEEAIAYKADVVQKVDEGKLSYRDLLDYLSDKTRVPACQINKEWHDLSFCHADFIAFMRDLKSRYDIYLLSNASSEFLRSLLGKHRLNDLFTRVFISAEIKLVKPHADYFEFALKELGFQAEECVFIDDNPINCEGAERVGIHAIRYQSAEQVEADLGALGVKR